MERAAQEHLTIIAPHYHWVREEFIRLRDKLQPAMLRPSTPVGHEVVDGKAALQVWEKSLRRSVRRFSSLLRAFSATILARSRRPGYVETQRALIPLGQEVNGLLILHRQLWQQPLAQQLQEGQALLSSAIEKMAADLDEIFTFFISTVEACACGCQPGAASYLWDQEVGCRHELAVYKRWAAAKSPMSWWLTKVMALPPLVAAAIKGVESRGPLSRQIVT